MVYKIILKNKNREFIFASNADVEMVTYLFKMYKKEVDNISSYFKRSGYDYKPFIQSETSLKRKMKFRPKINYTIEL